MTNQEPVIFPDSPEAATYRTDIKGWVSRKGLYYGDDEYLARHNGCTHTHCDDCGEAADHGRVYCSKCSAKRSTEKFLKLPAKEWDESTPLCLYKDDRYFYSMDDIDEYCEEYNVKPEDLQLVWCCKQPPPVFDEDYFSDWLEFIDDIEIPRGLLDAINDFNEKIRQHYPEIWIPDNIRAIL